MMNYSKTLLKKLSLAAATPANEGEVREIIRQELDGLAEFSYDKLGSIICRRNGGKDSPKVMLSGHMDEVGFIVRLITNDGFIKFHNLGGWWGHTMLSQRVTIKTAKGDVPGIIGAKPVHHLKPEERKNVMEISDMFIDVGAKDRQEAMDVFGIFPGDHIVPHTEFIEMKNPRILSGKAFDDRAGVAVIVNALKNLDGEDLPNAVYGVGSTQEEVGARGASTAVDLINPDVAIVLEGSPADDFPGTTSIESQGMMGQGAQIRVFDPTMIPNRALTQFVLETAKRCQLTHQVAVRVSGGTDGSPIHVHRLGVPTIVIAPPVRYVHGHLSMLHLDDFESTRDLLMELLRRLDAEMVASFTKF